MAQMKAFGLIPALDCERLEEASALVSRIGGDPFVRGVKVGFSLGLSVGLPAVVEALRRSCTAPIIYDHQKAGTDIPDTGALFARTLARAGIDAAILFPQAGPGTLRAWVHALQDVGIEPIGGGAMTHPGYLASEGGFIGDEALVAMYGLAREEGVASFVLPLTRPDLARRLVVQAGLGPECTFLSPGFGAQGGDPFAFDFLPRHHLIAGRALLQAKDPAAWLSAVRQQLEGQER